MAKPSRQRFPLLQRRVRPTGGNCRVDVLSPQGEFRRDPPVCGGARAPAKPALRQGALLYPSFSSPQERWSPAGADPANHRQLNPRTRTAGSKALDPRPAPGRRIVPGCRALNEGTTTRRQWRSRAGSAFCSAGAAAARRGGVDVWTPGRRPTADAGGQAPAKPSAAGAPGDFLVATRKPTRPPGRDQPITANRKHLKTKRQRSKVRTPACAGRRPLPTAMPAMEAPQPAGNGEAEPAAFPFCSAECSPRPAELSRRCLRPARGEFRRARRARAARYRLPALRQGRFLW